MLGTVSFFNRMKGWGFIVPDDLSRDVFVHVKNLPKDHKYLNPGDRVSFDLGESDRATRPLAVNIQVIQEASAVVR